MSALSSRKIFVVDDDDAMCSVVADWLARLEVRVERHGSAASALESLEREAPDAVLADLTMPEMDGLALCRAIAIERPSLPVLVMTAYGSMDAAVDAIRAGAYDFISKPFEREVLILALERAIEHAALRGEVHRLREARSPARSFGPLVGASQPMRKLYGLIERCANASATVLVRGESGTGKELVARALHDQSERARAPFVAVDCAALPETLVESQLFGHVQGAFTGAHRDQQGLFARAHGGTLFLDEIGELPITVQAKLLRALQERRVLPVGGDREIPVDTRVVAATHRDLEQLVADGRFREDLMYRLDVLSIAVPPLRARGNDILLLAEHFAAEASVRAGRRSVALSSPAADAILRYRWPGNVRELRNCIERSVILSGTSRIELEDLPEKILEEGAMPIAAFPDTTEGYLSLDEVERRYVLAVLDAHGGNKTEAGRVLGLDRRTIARKLQAWGIEP